MARESACGKSSIQSPFKERKTLAENQELKNLLEKLLCHQRLAVLGTQSKDGPYGNLLAFAATADLKRLLFATMRSTRKYGNIAENPRVSMVMDNRSNEEADFHSAVAITATGPVKELDGAARDELLSIFLKKHPYLVDFVTSPACALFQLEVETYYIVRQFQNVVQLHMTR